jgi:hypothetical protein
MDEAGKKSGPPIAIWRERRDNKVMVREGQIIQEVVR